MTLRLPLDSRKDRRLLQWYPTASDEAAIETIGILYEPNIIAVIGLLSQAGVAIGLALASADHFTRYGDEGQALGNLIINVITATTFVVQIVGPICVKLAFRRSGEIGKGALAENGWESGLSHST